jgi:hypothetical protein
MLEAKFKNHLPAHYLVHYGFFGGKLDEVLLLQLLSAFWLAVPNKSP